VDHFGIIALIVGTPLTALLSLDPPEDVGGVLGILAGLIAAAFMNKVRPIFTYVFILYIYISICQLYQYEYEMLKREFSSSGLRSPFTASLYIPLLPQSLSP
jgi:hypothetical protein